MQMIKMQVLSLALKFQSIVYLNSKIDWNILDIFILTQQSSQRQCSVSPATLVAQLPGHTVVLRHKGRPIIVFYFDPSPFCQCNVYFWAGVYLLILCYRLQFWYHRSKLLWMLLCKLVCKQRDTLNNEWCLDIQHYTLHLY